MRFPATGMDAPVMEDDVEATSEPAVEAPPAAPAQVVSLDAFRRKPAKDG